jgi:hypothetical protein
MVIRGRRILAKRLLIWGTMGLGSMRTIFGLVVIVWVCQSMSLSK